jgi:hypothetical protein
VAALDDGVGGVKKVGGGAGEECYGAVVAGAGADVAAGREEGEDAAEEGVFAKVTEEFWGRGSGRALRGKTLRIGGHGERGD